MQRQGLIATGVVFVTLLLFWLVYFLRANGAWGIGYARYLGDGWWPTRPRVVFYGSC
jgi:hypothetical protein